MSILLKRWRFVVLKALKELKWHSSRTATHQKDLIAACKEPKVGKAIIRALQNLFALSPETDLEGYYVAVAAACSCIKDGVDEKKMLYEFQDLAYFAVLEALGRLKTGKALEDMRVEARRERGLPAERSAKAKQIFKSIEGCASCPAKKLCKDPSTQGNDLGCVDIIEEWLIKRESAAEGV